MVVSVEADHIAKSLMFHRGRKYKNVLSCCLVVEFLRYLLCLFKMLSWTIHLPSRSSSASCFLFLPQDYSHTFIIDAMWAAIRQIDNSFCGVLTHWGSISSLFPFQLDNWHSFLTFQCVAEKGTNWCKRPNLSSVWLGLRLEGVSSPSESLGSPVGSSFSPEWLSAAHMDLHHGLSSWAWVQCLINVKQLSLSDRLLKLRTFTNRLHLLILLNCPYNYVAIKLFWWIWSTIHI